MTAQSELHFPNIHNYMPVGRYSFYSTVYRPRFETLTICGSELVGEIDASMHAIMHGLIRTACYTSGATTDLVH